MEGIFFWVSAVGFILTGGAFMWYFASIGKAIHEEEQAVGKDLTYEINPFTGSSKTRDPK